MGQNWRHRTFRNPLLGMHISIDVHSGFIVLVTRIRADGSMEDIRMNQRKKVCWGMISRHFARIDARYNEGETTIWLNYIPRFAGDSALQLHIILVMWSWNGELANQVSSDM